MNKNQTWRRVLSLLCAMVMLVGIMVVGSVVASAAEEDTTYVAQIGDVEYTTLQDAMNAAKNGDTVELLADCYESFTYKQKTGVSITVNGKKDENSNYRWFGSLAIDGDKRSDGAESLTLTHIDFVVDREWYPAISTVSKTYAHRVNISYCNFYGEGAGANASYAIVIRHAYNFNISNCYANGLYDFFYSNYAATNFVFTDITLENLSYGFYMPYLNNLKFERVTGTNISEVAAYIINNSNGSTTTKFTACEFDAPICFEQSSAEKHEVVFDDMSADFVVVNNSNSLTVKVDTTDAQVNVTVQKEGQNVAVKDSSTGNVITPNEDGSFGAVLATPITSATVSGQYLNDGKEKFVKLIVKAGETVLVKGVDYELSGDVSATAPGTYTVVVKGIGEYGGEIEVEWTILNHEYESTVTPPTCTEQGYTTHVCKNCQTSYVDTYVPATGHSFVEHTIPATCTEGGGVHDHCTVCDLQVIKERYPAAHTWNAGEYTEPTVYADGYTTYTCIIEGCNGTKVVTDAGTKLTPVASVGEELFASLAAAVEAAKDNGTIILVKSVTETFAIPANYVVTIDLNGFVIDGTGTTRTINIKNGASLTIKDTSEAKTGAVKCGTENAGNTIQVQRGSTFVLESGTIYCTNNAIYTGSTYDGNRANIVINGGAIISENGSAMYVMIGSNITVNGGEISGPYGIQLFYNTNGDSTITITGGKITAKTNTAVLVPYDGRNNNNYTNTDLIITGGTIVGARFCVIYETTGGLNITGGSFSTDVKALCAEGYCTAKNGDLYVVGTEQFDGGVYTAPTFEKDAFTTYTCLHCGETKVETHEGTKLVAVVSIDGVPYASLAEAVSAVPNGGTATIKVLNDYTESHFRTSGNFALAVWVGNKKNITIDFDGHTVTFDARAYNTQYTYTLFYVASAGASLTLTGNGTIRDDHGSDLRINVVWAQSGVITNENCNFYIDDAVAGSDLFYVNNGGTIYINGGKHEFTNSYINALNSNPGIVIVSGGSFKKDIIAETQEGEVQLADGYCLAPANADGLYVVDKEELKAEYTDPTFEKDAFTTYTCLHCGETYVETHEGTKLVGVATVNGNPYTTLQKAHYAAAAGETITLIANVVLDEEFVITKNIVLDGNGFTITGTVTINALNVVVQNVKFDKGYIYQENKKMELESSLKVLNCTFANGGYAVTTNRLGSLTIDGCTVTDQSLLYAKLSTLNIYVANTTVARGNYGAHIVYADNNIVFENVTMTNMNHFGIMTQNYGEKTITLKNCNIDAPIPFATQPVLEGITDNFVFDGENKVASIANNMYNEYSRFFLKSGTLQMPNAVTVKSYDASKTAVYNTNMFILVDSVKIVNSHLVLGNTIDVRFGIENVKSQMTVTVRFAGTTYILTAEDAAQAGGYYAFNGVIVAKQMTEAITVTVTYLDGTVLATETFTVREYAEDIMGGNYSKAAKNLAMALLNYGAAAQNAFISNVAAKDLANNGTDYTVYQAGAADGVVNGYTDPDNSYYGASLNLNNGINFNFKFFADMVEGFDYVVVTDLLGEEIVRYEADSEKLGADFKNQRDLVVVPVDLSGKDANQTLVCTFYTEAETEETEDTMLTYGADSVLGYCARALEKAPETGAFSKKFYQTLANYVVAIRYYNEGALPEIPEVDTEGETENV